MSNQRYMMRGVSASKEDAQRHQDISHKGIFQKRFAKLS